MKGNSNMKLINEKGKLFGLINVIDFIVIVFVAAAVGIGGFAFIRNSGTVPTPSQEARVKNSTVFQGPTSLMEFEFYSEEVSDFVADGLFIGAEMFDDTASKYLGTVTRIEKGPSDTYSVNSEGQSVKTSREGYYSVRITGEVLGQRTPTGATVSGEHYGLGHSMVLRAGDAKIYLRLSGITAKPRRLRRDLSEGDKLYEELIKE
jgi:hypothetical protein